MKLMNGTRLVNMTLVSELEGAFDVTFDTDDIVNFSSYKEEIFYKN